MSLAVSAQKGEKLPEDDEKMLGYLTNLFEDQRKDYGKNQIEKKLSKMWLEENAFSQGQKNQFRATLNLFIEIKAKVFPDYDNYIQSFINFSNSGKSELELKEWNDLVVKLYSDKKLKKYGAEFVESSLGLFRDLTFYKNESLQWKTSNNSYRFVFDSLPHITFDEMNLKCLSRGDSSVIYKTTGNYFPTLEKFYGNAGRVTWQRAGYDPEKTYVSFNRYNIKIKETRYVIDSVMFYNEFFDKPLSGKLTEKIIGNKTEETATYPMFESYYQRLEIKNIVPNVDYEGGFNMSGKKLEGTGTMDTPASLIFYREKKAFLTAQSLLFEIRPDRIQSSSASIKMRLDSDSIYHPELFFMFTKKT
ncbi:MAG: hypothetical protein NWR69_01130, partial [Flavobacteriales bacterium]|nr:hypothetical protein [Flavobacteriales bacterium]